MAQSGSAPALGAGGRRFESYIPDQHLVLQLDHINGINNDNRLENLRFLCPNCHTQQDTYAAKNIKKQFASVGEDGNPQVSKTLRTQFDSEHLRH